MKTINDQTQKDNRLIAEFMGAKMIVENYHGINIIKFPDETTKDLFGLHYHSSWDWLMPVIHKIIKTIGVKCIDECTDVEWFVSTRITRMYIGIDIKHAHYYCVEFIHWYNKQQKQS